MKIKLKHLTPYLPYGLKARLSHEGKFNLDSEYPNEYANKTGIITSWNIDNSEIGGILKVNDNYSFDFCEISEIEILLRTLSDLTKEIDVNGSKFIPLLELAKIAYPKVLNPYVEDDYINLGHGYTFFFNKKDMSFECRKRYNRKTWDENCHVNNQLQLFEKLFEWHIDLFDLIKNDLAIDINSL